MPRTKITRMKERKREAILREEKVRLFGEAVEHYSHDLLVRTDSVLNDINTMIQMLIDRTSEHVLQMKVDDFMHMSLCKFSDYSTPNMSAITPRLERLPNEHLYKSTKMVTAVKRAYVDSVGSSGYGSITSHDNFCETPKEPSFPPKKKLCRNNVNTQTTIEPPSSVTRSAEYGRRRIHTPLSAHTKNVRHYVTPRFAVLRWPRVNETVVSVRGTPLATSVAPITLACINIPTEDGVLSVQPRQLTSELVPRVIKSLKPTILKQLEILQENLAMIRKMADKYHSN